MPLFTTDIKHPDEFSKISGQTKVIGRLEAIEQSIGLILRSARGEMFGDPDFGCNLYTYLYQFDGPALYQLIKEDVADSVNKWESRVHVETNDVQVTSVPNEKTIEINVVYHLKNTEYKYAFSFKVVRNTEDVLNA